MSDRPGRKRPLSSKEKSFRFDSPYGKEATDRAVEPASGLLDDFRRWFAARPRESRRAARHAARTYVVWLGWWQGEGDFLALKARLANISRGGALVYVRKAPPEAHPVWICLGTPEPDECLAATTLEVRNTRSGECAIRLAFQAPCPSRFLEAVVCGRASERLETRRPGA
jgi:hypothetical protein